jgi:predicted amidophosphoribosyltransferase
MTFCPECGKNVGASQKFCRSCGASLIEASPAPAAPPAPPSGGLSCRSCGAPLAPDEKFCGSCGARTGEVPPAPAPVYQAPAPAYQAPPPVYRAPPPPAYQAPPPVYQAPPPPAYHQPPPPQYAAPAPVAPAAGGLVCRACGTPIRPGDKFCSKCLVKIPDTPAPAPAYQVPPPAYQAPPPPAYPQPPPPPPPQYAAAAPGGYVCATCGSPVSGSEKFCGICGATVVAARSPTVPAPVPAPAAPPAGKFCASCGAAISSTTKFCGSCGATVTTAPPGGGGASFRPAPPVMSGGEEVIGVIANARKMKMFGASWDTWNLVVTSRRMIMVQMTAAMLTAAVTQAQAQAKAEGKGFFGIMKDQLSAQFRFAVRYETMNPDMALAETPGNIAVENARITAIKMKLRDTGSGNTEYTEFKMIIESSDGKFEYMMAEDERFINLLKQVYGDRVHMPFGYFKVGAARIKFF